MDIENLGKAALLMRELMSLQTLEKLCQNPNISIEILKKDTDRSPLLSYRPRGVEVPEEVVKVMIEAGLDEIHRLIDSKKAEVDEL